MSKFSFKKTKYYRHCNNYDIDYKVLEIKSSDSLGTKIEVLPIHRRHGWFYNSLICLIKSEDYYKWQELTQEQVDKSRGSKASIRNYAVNIPSHKDKEILK